MAAKNRRPIRAPLALQRKTTTGTTVVIELKAGKADRETIGQILGYMGDLQQHSKKPVRGIIVAGDFAPAASFEAVGQEKK